MTIHEALSEFNQYNQKIKESLQKLREEVKKQTSYQIQEYMLGDQFERANEMMKELEDFIHLDLLTNAEDIAKHVQALYINGSERLIVETSPSASPSPSFPSKNRNKEELDSIERDIIETIGYTGASKLADLPAQATERHIHQLQTKGYLSYETKHWSDNYMAVFHLTPKGKRYFQERSGSNASVLVRMMPVATALADVEPYLQEAGFEILGKQEDVFEIQMEFKSCYLMLPEENLSLQMEKKSHLKNIAYICKDEQHINDTYEKVKQWVSQNKEKSKCLSLHYTTLATLQDNHVNPFRTVHF